jgi:hypothetical protein
VRRVLRWAWLLFAIAPSACGSRGRNGSTNAEARDGAALERAIPAPQGLLARAWIRSPDATWGSVQRGVGGAVALMPSTTGEIACALAGIDPSFAPLVDGHQVSFALVAERGGIDGGATNGLGWALALPLVGDVQTLHPGAFGAGRRRVGGMRVLTRQDRASHPAVGTAPGWLVIARDDEDLERLGPYTYRTMPTEPAPSSGAPVVAIVAQTALGGTLAARLSSGWAGARDWLLARAEEDRARHGGRSPDFGDPSAIVEAADSVVQRRIALVASAQGARVEVGAGDGDVHAELIVTPGADDRDAGPTLLEEMRPGDPLPLLDLPSDAPIALLVRDDADARLRGAREFAAVLRRALGPRLRDDEARVLVSALDDWARARGDWMTVALRLGRSPGVILRAPVATDEAAQHAVNEIVALSRRPAIEGPLASLLHGVGRAGGSVDVAGSVRDHHVVLAAGERAAKLLSVADSPSTRLGDDARVVRALSALGSSTTFALLAQPLRLDAARAGDDSAPARPAILAWGKRDGDAWARVELADGLLKEIIVF